MSQLRFFADHCVPTSIVRFLQECGHEVFVLRECIPKDSPDVSCSSFLQGIARRNTLTTKAWVSFVTVTHPSSPFRKASESLDNLGFPRALVSTAGRQDSGSFAFTIGFNSCGSFSDTQLLLTPFSCQVVVPSRLSPSG
jgi:hypothetical protein